MPFKLFQHPRGAPTKCPHCHEDIRDHEVTLFFGDQAIPSQLLDTRDHRSDPKPVMWEYPPERTRMHVALAFARRFEPQMSSRTPGSRA